MDWLRDIQYEGLQGSGVLDSQAPVHKYPDNF